MVPGPKPTSQPKLEGWEHTLQKAAAPTNNKSGSGEAHPDAFRFYIEGCLFPVTAQFVGELIFRGRLFGYQFAALIAVCLLYTSPSPRD